MSRYIDTNFLDYLRHVRSVRKTRSGILLQVDGEQMRVDVLRDDVLRIKISQGGVFDEQPTFAACFDPRRKAAFTVKQTRLMVEVSTSRMRLRISRVPFAVDAYRTDGSTIFETHRTPAGEPQFYGFLNNKFVVTRQSSSRDAFLGLGEKTRGLNKNGHDYILWNTDILGPDTTRELHDLPKDHPSRDPRSAVFDPYYVSIPFFYHVPADADEARAAGFFVDNGYKGYFEFSHGGFHRFQFCGGQYTEYVFAGPAIRDALEAYTWVTGRMQAPPLWALGYHQCRWYPYTQKTLLGLGAKFRRKRIPCDVLWMDIDYMNGYRVFTWNRKTFPNARGMLRQLRRAGFRAITIIDPGVKAEPGYAVFDEGHRKNLFCKAGNGQTYIGQVWPGRTAFPDFTKREARAWWGRLNAEHVRSGLDGIWNDMNEPSTGGVGEMDMQFDFEGANHPHERYHNQYGFLMAMGTTEGLRTAMPNLRTFILSRAGFSGIQRYAANWMGDNMSRWDHLAMSIPMAMGLGISGQPFVGADVGGFGEATQPELLVRWMQCGALTPFFRNHSSDAKDQYPWSFGDAVESLCREAIGLRYRLMPYLYSTFMSASETGEPVQRPLVLDYQSDATAAYIDDQYLFGPALLVAPVCEAGTVSRRVYLPRGTWVDWQSGRRYDGGRYITAEAPIEYIPVFARGGQVIPMLEKTPLSTMALRPKSLDLHVIIPREDGTFRSLLHEDDGLTFGFEKGKYLRTAFELRRNGSRIRLQARVTGRGFPEFARKEFRIVFRGAEVKSARVDRRAAAVRSGAIVLPNAGTGFVLEAEVAGT